MRNYLKLLFFPFSYFIVFYADKSFADLQIFYIILFNTLMFTVFNLFDLKSKRSAISNESEYKEMIFVNLLTSLKNPFNLFMIFSPLILIYFGDSFCFDALDFILLFVIIINLFINIIILNATIINLHIKYSSIHIVIVGIIFHAINSIFEQNYFNLYIIGLSYLLLSYVSILIAYYSKKIRVIDIQEV